ncbi:MAG TPA: FHA domain-containing protein [Herpetosiphonaceae bacterium]
MQTNTAKPAPLSLEAARSELSFGLLVITYPDGREDIVDLVRATTHVGQASDNDVVLDHELIADHHAQILCDWTGCQVIDLGSHIGSQILEREEIPDKRSIVGKRLPPKVPHPLEKGTTVLMGEVVLIYYPSVKDIPKAAPVGDNEPLVRILHLISAVLLMVCILGTSAVWLRGWWLGATSLATSAPPRTATPIPPTPAPTAPPTIAFYSYAVETDYKLNLHIRVAPGLDQQILGKIPFGTAVKVYGDPVPRDGYHWVRVDAPNLSGWCVIEALRRE